MGPNIWKELRVGVRSLLRAPGWTLVVAATLALVIGLATSIFSLANAVLLEALPYPEPDRLVALWATSPGAAAANVPRFNPSSADWVDWQAQATSFEALALARSVNFNLSGDGTPERVVATRASANLLSVLRLEPLFGRMFSPEEAAGDAKVVLLSHAFWQRRFAGDRAVIGRRLTLGGEPFEVIGVMPAKLRAPSPDFDVVAPLYLPAAELKSRLGFLYRAVGRLKPEVTLAQAQEEMSAIMKRLAAEHPTSNGKLGIEVLLEPLLESTIGNFRPTLRVLIAAVGCLLILGVINLAGLLVVRASGRGGELALRAALGAEAGSLRRLLLVEVLPLAGLGTVGGALLGWWLLKGLVPLLPAGLPVPQTTRLDGRMFAFAALLSLAVVTLAALLPALRVARPGLSAALARQGRTVVGGGWLRHGLVVAQVAVAVLLVFVGGLLLRSLAAVGRVDPGFSAEEVLTLSLEVTRSRYPTPAALANYYRELTTGLKAVPGVREAAFINLLPLGSGKLSGPLYFEVQSDGSWLGADSRTATPGYFAALGIPLLRGRDFTADDQDGTRLVGIIDEQLARAAFKDGDPLGKRMRFGVVTDSTPWVEIVGVVGHVRNETLESDPRPQVYWPVAQQPPERGALVVRTEGRPEGFASSLVAKIHEVNAEQPLYNVRPLRAELRQSLKARHLLTGLISILAGSSLLLACLGLYGVVSYGIGLRLKEFALRLAHGASPADVLRLVWTYIGRLTLLGLGLGLGSALLATRLVESQLFGVGRTDGVALLWVLAAVVGSVLLAGLGPALRARRVDPAVILRGE